MQSKLRYTVGMKTALFGVSCFTAAASSWLIVMYFVLQHPGYEWRAALAALFVAMSVLTVSALAGWADGGWTRPLLLVGSAGLLLAGASAIRTNFDSRHFEGFAVIIGLALALQGVLTLLVFWRPYSQSFLAAPQR